jgi:hypothetical protein
VTRCFESKHGNIQGISRPGLQNSYVLRYVQAKDDVQDESKKICPKSAVDQVLAGLGADEDFLVDDEVQTALGMLAENMLEQTMEFAALMASRRNSKWLQVCSYSMNDKQCAQTLYNFPSAFGCSLWPSVSLCGCMVFYECNTVLPNVCMCLTSHNCEMHADHGGVRVLQMRPELSNKEIATNLDSYIILYAVHWWVAMQAKDLECYLERVWHISLPGFSSRCITAAPKIVAESADMKNRASVRSYLAQLPVQQWPSDGEKNEEGEALADS